MGFSIADCGFGIADWGVVMSEQGGDCYILSLRFASNVKTAADDTAAPSRIKA